MSYSRILNFFPSMPPLLSVGLAAWLALAPSVQAQQVKARLSVGTIAPLSGPMALYGKDLVNGMSLAVDVLKSRDRDLGERINIVAKDNLAKSAPTVEIANDLAESRQADVFVGSVSSITTETLIAEAERLNRPLLAPSAADQGLSKRKGVFRTCLDNLAMGGMLSQFAVQSLKQRSAVILYDSDSQYSAALGKAFVTDFTRRGGKILQTLSYRRGDGSFRAQLSTIKRLGPGVIVVPGFYEEVGRIMKQALQLGMRIPMLGADGWDSPGLIQLAGKRAIRGHYFISHFSSEDPDEKVQAFVNAYRRRYGRLPTLTSAMGYDGMLVLAEAFSRAQTNLSGPLKRALSNTRKVEGLLGPMYFPGNHTVVKPGVILSTTGSGWRFHSRVIPDLNSEAQGG